MGFDDNTLPMAASEESGSLQAGQLFGRYLIVDQVGAGGVGEVYAAYDPSLDRRIALKVIRGAVDDDTSQGAAGLVREAKALASLSHPNVVTVHEVGQEDERVYVAMELVDGRDLERWIDENTARPWRVTLGVFLDAGRGLAAAHARGILHRDFKPANVLIGHDDWVRVSDFGLATLLSSDDKLTVSRSEDESSSSTGEASKTLEGGMVGTPYYMAPEQLDGNATVRSDIYAFCLALHDALYGVRAFEADSLLELATLKSTQPPSDPGNTRAVPTLVRSAIERGLQPDPGERWPSMDALLAELQQALSPPTRSAVPWLLGLGGIAAGAAFLVQSTPEPCTGAAEALEPTWNSARRAAVATGIAESTSPIAAETTTRLEPKLDAFANAWTQSHSRVCEATQRGEQSTVLLDQRMSCLQRQLLDFNAVLDVLEQADAQVVRRAIRVASTLPQPARCESQPAGSEAAEASPALEKARAQQAHIEALLAAGKYSDAQPLAEALLESSIALEAPRFQGEVLVTLGNSLSNNGRLDEAVNTLERAAFQGVGSNAPKVVLEAATVLTVVESEAGHPDAGLRWSRLAEATLESAGGRDSDRAVHHANRAAAFSRKEDHQAAEAAIRKALEYSDDVTEQQRVNLLQTLAGVLFYQSRFDEAITHQEQALEELKSTVGQGHPAVGLGLFNLGTFYISQGKFAQGEQLLADALEIQEHSLDPYHTDIADTLNSIGASLYQQSKFEAAAVPLERALEIKARELSADHPQVLDASTNVALLIAENGELDRGVTMLESVVRRIEESEDTPPSTRSSAFFNLARLWQKQGRLDEAQGLLEKVLRIDEERLGEDAPQLAPLVIGLGVLRKAQERPQEALALYERALEIQKGTLEPTHPANLAVLNNIAATHLVLDAPHNAKDVAGQLLEASKAREDYIGRAKYLLAQAHLALGERTEARRLGREALVLHRELPALADELTDIEAFVDRLD
ncbi:MAG: tetratricopeptide repeat protein [Nannocystales bacterium]